MAYCTNAKVRLFAPQAKEGLDLEGYIEIADAVIDSRLRVIFDVPLTTVPNLIADISGKLAAAEFLKAMYAKVNQESPKQSNALYSEAMQSLADIVSDPNLLDLPVKNPEAEDEERNEVYVAGEGEGVFNMGDETKWG